MSGRGGSIFVFAVLQIKPGGGDAQNQPCPTARACIGKHLGTHKEHGHRLTRPHQRMQWSVAARGHSKGRMQADIYDSLLNSEFIEARLMGAMKTRLQGLHDCLEDASELQLHVDLCTSMVGTLAVLLEGHRCSYCASNC